jgi:CBS domain-containing protein
MKPICVRDVYDPKKRLSVLVRADEPLEDILRRFAQEAWLRGIFVTDEVGRLVGVITRTDLLDWTRLRLGTALGGTGAARPDRVMRLAQLVGAASARDAIRPASQQTAVQLDVSVDRALQLMIEADLITVPVVDNEGCILGDLTLSHILRYLLDLEDSGQGQT